MNKNEFLNRLKEDLSSLTDEERLNALKYYEEYFADAGEEQEDEIITEFVSPEDLANKIQEDITVNTIKEIYDEKVPEAPGAPKLVLTDKIEEINGMNEMNEPDKININNKIDETEKIDIIEIEIKKEDKKENNTQYQTQSQNQNNYYKKTNNSGDNMLKIILLLCTAPFWLPILISLASVAFGVFMAILGAAFAVAALAVAGFIMVGAGFISIGFGITNIFFDFFNAFYPIGAGFVTIGIGLIFAYGFTKLAALMFKSQFKFVKWAIRGLTGKLAGKNA